MTLVIIKRRRIVIIVSVFLLLILFSITRYYKMWYAKDDNWGLMENTKPISDPESWIKSTKPLPGETVPSTTNIEIIFKQNMDMQTLNENTILIYEAKHNSIISKLFKYEYDARLHKLNISFIIPNNSYGTGNSIVVYITSKVQNSQHIEMGQTNYFGFYTY